MNKIEIVYYNLWKRETFNHMVDDYRRIGNRYIEAVSIEENNKFFLECYQENYNKRGYKYCDNWLRGLLVSYVKRCSLENGDTPYYKRYYKDWIDNTKWISGDFPELQKWCDEYMNYLDSIDTTAEATTQTTDNEQIISMMKRTSYDIELLKRIWENLSPDQRMECLRQADRGDCSTPLGLNVDVWKAATHYMDHVGLARAAHIEGGECEAIRLTVSGKAMLSQLESNTKWIDISNLRTKASHYVDLIQHSRDYHIPKERADIKETINGLHDAISHIDVDSLPTTLSGFNTNRTYIVSEMKIVVSVINGLTALLGDYLPDIKQFDPKAAEVLKFCKRVNPIMHQVLQTLESRRRTDPTFDDEKAMERFNCFAMGDYDDMSLDEFVTRHIINGISQNDAIRRLNNMIDRCDDEQTKWLLVKFKYWRGCDGDVIRELHDAMTEFIRFFDHLAQLSPIPSNGNRAEATTRLFSVMEWCKLHDTELKKQLVDYPLTKDIEDLNVLAKHIVDHLDKWSSVVGNDAVAIELINDVAMQIDNAIEPAIKQRKPTSPTQEPETATAEAVTPATSPDFSHMKSYTPTISFDMSALYSFLIDEGVIRDVDEALFSDCISHAHVNELWENGVISKLKLVIHHLQKEHYSQDWFNTLCLNLGMTKQQMGKFNVPTRIEFEHRMKMLK